LSTVYHRYASLPFGEVRRKGGRNPREAGAGGNLRVLRQETGSLLARLQGSVRRCSFRGVCDRKRTKEDGVRETVPSGSGRESLRGDQRRPGGHGLLGMSETLAFKGAPLSRGIKPPKLTNLVSAKFQQQGRNGIRRRIPYLWKEPKALKVRSSGTLPG